MQAYKAEQQQKETELEQRLAAAVQACKERDATIQRCKEAMGSEPDAAALQSYQAAASGSADMSGPDQLSPVQLYSQRVSLLRENNSLKQKIATLQSEWQQVCCK